MVIRVFKQVFVPPHRQWCAVAEFKEGSVTVVTNAEGDTEQDATEAMATKLATRGFRCV